MLNVTQFFAHALFSPSNSFAGRHQLIALAQLSAAQRASTWKMLPATLRAEMPKIAIQRAM